jgi:hypothetical protein
MSARALKMVLANWVDGSSAIFHSPSPSARKLLYWNQVEGC